MSLLNVFKKTSKRILTTGFSISVVAVALHQFVGFPARVISGSMCPTLCPANVQIAPVSKACEIPTPAAQLLRWLWKGEAIVHVVVSGTNRVQRIQQLRWLSLLTAPFGLEIYELRSSWQRRWILLPTRAAPTLLDRLFQYLEFGGTNTASPHVLELKIKGPDWIWVDRFFWRFCRPRRFDVVAFRLPASFPWAQEYRGLLIKRVVAFENERVEILDDGTLRINGQAFRPNMLQWVNDRGGYWNQKRLMNHGLAPISPLFPAGGISYRAWPGTVLLFGDNTCYSFDSRFWGGIPVRCLIGRVVAVIWPPDGWRRKIR